MASPRALFSLAAVLVLGLVPPAGAETVLCRTVRLPKVSTPATAFRPYTRLRVRDRIMPGGRTVDVRKPAAACFPVGIDGATVAADADPLAGYRTHPSRTSATAFRRSLVLATR